MRHNIKCNRIYETQGQTFILYLHNLFSSPGFPAKNNNISQLFK